MKMDASGRHAGNHEGAAGAAQAHQRQFLRGAGHGHLAAARSGYPGMAMDTRCRPSRRLHAARRFAGGFRPVVERRRGAGRVGGHQHRKKRIRAARAADGIGRLCRPDVDRHGDRFGWALLGRLRLSGLRFRGFRLASGVVLIAWRASGCGGAAQGIRPLLRRAVGSGGAASRCAARAGALLRQIRRGLPRNQPQDPRRNQQRKQHGKGPTRLRRAAPPPSCPPAGRGAAAAVPGAGYRVAAATGGRAAHGRLVQPAAVRQRLPTPRRAAGVSSALTNSSHVR